MTPRLGCSAVTGSAIETRIIAAHRDRAASLTQ